MRVVESGAGPDPSLVGEGRQENAEPLADRPRMKANWAQIGVMMMAVIGFLYFARPVMLPVLLAWLTATALKPLMRWMALAHIPRVLGAAIIFFLLVAGVGLGFFQLARPALHWVDDAPQHMADLRARVQKLFPNALRMSQAVNAVTEMNVAGEPKKKEVPAVQVTDGRGAASILNWTGTVVAGLAEILVLIYLLLASGDLFMQKFVRLMPSLRDKKRVVEIAHEIQANLSNYLFAVSIINLSLGTLAMLGFYFLGVPRAPMWGMLAAVLNFVPYFGPVAGVLTLGVVGLLTFNTIWQALLPAGWYLALHLSESYFISPILLGKHFTLNPVAIFISLLFWLWLWGVPGALLSVPLLVSVKAVCDRFPQAAYFSELIGS